MEGDPGQNVVANVGTPHPRRRRRVILLVVLTFVGIFFYRVLQPRPPVIEAVSPDGKYRLRFIAGGVGKIDHRPDSQPYVWFYDFAKGWMPVVLFNKLSKPQNVFQAGQPTDYGADRLMVMFEKVKLGPPAQADFLQSPFEDMAIVFEDSTGDSFEQKWSQAIVGRGHTLFFDVFPRRDKVIHLKVLQQSTRRELMSIAIPNDSPSANQFSSKPAAPPVVLSTPEVRCTLAELATTDSMDTVRPVLKVESIAPAWTHHTLESALEDANGNRGPRLSPFESCWKVRALVCRTIEAEFAPEEIWQSPALAVPQDKSATTLGSKGRLDSTSVTLLCMKGPGLGQVEEVTGKWDFSERQAHRSIRVPGRKPGEVHHFGMHMPFTEKPFVLLDLEDLAPEHHVFVRIRDQDGQTLGQASDPETRFMKTRCRCAVEFEPRETTKEVVVSVIISKPQVFEFYVQPPAELRAKHTQAGLK